MTTLPQTTAIRLQRTPASQGLVPSSGAPAGLIPAAAGAPLTGADAWRVIRSHMLLILIFAVVSAGGGVALNWFLLKYYPTYTATGHLQVQTSMLVDPIRKVYTVMEASQLTAEQRTQAAMIRSEGNIAAAFAEGDSELRRSKWFEQYRHAGPKGEDDVANAKDDLLKNLAVLPVPDSKLIQVRLKGNDPKSCKTILEELVDLHIKNQKGNVAKIQEEQRRVLDQLVRTYRQRVDEDQMKLSQTQEQMKADGFLRTGEGSHRDLLEIELLQLMEQFPKIQEAAGEAAGRYESFMRDVQQGRTPAAVENMARERDPRVNQLNNYTMNLKMELAVMLREYGPEHRAVRQQQARIKEAEDQYDKVWAEAVLTYRKLLESTYADSYQQTQKIRAELLEKIETSRRNVAKFNTQMVKLLQAQSDLKLSRELHREAADQFRDLTIIQETQNNAKVMWIEKPEKPEIPTFPKLWMTMSAAIVLGLGLALGIAFLREVTNTKVRTPRDIARVGPMNVLGIIPDDSEDPAAANTILPLVIFTAPHSMTAEQFRQVRTRLQHSAALDTTRSIMVTGPSPEDGKTTVACNLAAGLALNGRKILLVDANFRRPELHRIFKVASEQGFGGVLDGTVHFDDVIHETQVPNLSVMPSGPKPPNPTELFESQLLIDFIERALEEYDHVIFDSGPLLVVSESVAMAPRVDGVVTVVRAHRDSRGLLSRMRELLRQVKAEHLGIVLNAVRHRKGGYYSGAIKAYYRYQSTSAPVAR